MYENFERILKVKGITPYRLAKDTGIAQSCLSDWKSRRSIPRVDKLIKIAEYLDVDLEELVQKEGEKKRRMKEEKKKEISEMTDREILRLQLEQLAEVSKDCLPEELADITKSMIAIVSYIESSRNQ